jgi:hypothetical protein
VNAFGHHLVRQCASTHFCAQQIRCGDFGLALEDTCARDVENGLEDREPNPPPQ